MIDAGYRRKHLDKWVFLCMGDAEKLERVKQFVLSGEMPPGEYGIELGMGTDLMHWHFQLKQPVFKCN